MQKFDQTPESQQEMKNIYGTGRRYQDAFNKAQRNMQALTAILTKSGNLYTIQGSDHMKFTDMRLFFGFQKVREALQIGGETDPARCLQITSALVVAFFDQYLKGQSSTRQESLPRFFPELQKFVPGTP